MMCIIDINKFNCYFFFPKINVRSYIYSKFFYNFRKQILNLKVKSVNNFSAFQIQSIGSRNSINFFEYSYYFLSVDFYKQNFIKSYSWFGVYGSIFFSFLELNKFVSLLKFNFSNLFLFNGSLSLVILLKIFNQLYYSLLQFLFYKDLKSQFNKLNFLFLYS